MASLPRRVQPERGSQPQRLREKIGLENGPALITLTQS
jgi:hypothetical protein